MAFFPGSTGAIYRQFAVTLALSISFSGLLALTLTPALCAMLLKPRGESHADSRKHGYFGRFFLWFNRWRSEEHTSELQSLMRISYAVFCLKQKNRQQDKNKSI